MSKELMNVNIGDRDWSIQANLYFMRYLNDKYNSPEAKGQNIGLNSLIMKLDVYDPEGLIDAIKAGTANESQKPATRDIEAFIDGQDDLVWMFDAVCEGLKKSSTTHSQENLIRERMAEQRAEIKAQKKAQLEKA